MGVFRRLLIANRGEVAIRIARAAADLGVPTTAVFTRDDSAAPHLAKADEAVALPGSGVAGYLDADQLLDAAQHAGADALHPGYGFLSESAEFARACAERGLTFVGPRPETLQALGDKTTARSLAAAADVPVLAGSAGPVTLDDAIAFQRSLPAPGAVMLKAVAGGGGRGMRRVLEPAELPGAYRRCASETMTAFGSDQVFVEQLLPRARHVEVQLVGDGTSAVTQLGDRDCSIQRLHQKVVEVAPSPALPDEIRAQLLAAAVRLGESVRYAGLGTVEFLVTDDGCYFLEVNPRLQVEHPVTEEVTGVDLVRAQLALAAGASLRELRLTQDEAPIPSGTAIQARITTETLRPDGSTEPAAGTLTAFELPAGRGIRVDAAGYLGYRTSLRYDGLLAKLVVHDRDADFGTVAARAYRALCECHIDGVDTNLPVLAGITGHPSFAAGELRTDFLDRNLAEILAGSDRHPRRYLPSTGAAGAAEAGPRGEPVPEAFAGVHAQAPGTIVAVDVVEGDKVAAGAPLVVLEAMKMEHVLAAPVAGTVTRITAAVGDAVSAGDLLVVLEPDEHAADQATDLVTDVDPDHIRPDLAEILHRHAVGQDENRPDAVQRRRDAELRTARENLADLCDPDSFVEYGPLAVAAQRQRRSLDELVERTPADGLIGGTATINAGLVGPDRSRAVVLSYDYTVLAGTQGFTNHKKKDRLFELAARRRLPVVAFAEGGGGRPGDTDGSWVSMLDVPAFHLWGRLSGLVPLVGVVAGRCFAGNAALLGVCDVIIAVRGASIGMGGPAMIEGGGLGVVHPDDVGHTSVQAPNGVIDMLVDDEAEAVRVARQYLSYFQAPVQSWSAPDPRELRQVVPENRVRVYDVRRAVHGIADVDSVLELRPHFGTGMITALIRVEGRPMGVIANNPAHLGGAIDRDAADKAARFMQLCDAFRLPILALCDTPGFMVGPESEAQAVVRHFSRLFVIGSNLTVPIGMVVLRKCYGLGGQSMGGGHTKAPAFTVAWPTGEFGGMGLEGAVRLGYRRELAAVADPDERQALFDRMVAAEYEKGKAANTATVFEIDDVIDPADTRRWITSAFGDPVDWREVPPARPCVDTW